jgi:hypothetical protein
MDHKQNNISVYIIVIGMICVLADKYERSVLSFLQSYLPHSLFVWLLCCEYHFSHLVAHGLTQLNVL